MAKTKKHLRLWLTDDGIQLGESALWLDSFHCGKFSFLSSAMGALQRFSSHVITTEETLRILKVFRKSPKALVCQYNRPFSIGQHTFELLPSGSILGGAVLYMETQNLSTLYISNAQQHKLPFLRNMQIKPADRLIIKSSDPDPFTANYSRHKEKNNLLNLVSDYVSQQSWPVIYCPPTPTAQELTYYLTERGFPVLTHPTIYRVNNIYSSAGAQLGPYSLYNSDKLRNRAVVLLPLSQKASFYDFPERKKIIVKGYADSLPRASCHEEFLLKMTSLHENLPELIEKISPKEVYLVGNFASPSIKHGMLPAPIIKTLCPLNQPSLL